MRKTDYPLLALIMKEGHEAKNGNSFRKVAKKQILP